ncbi:ligase-associated DNA damage response endonuclease PdeM [Robiginitalea aurantiaca]|uniref:Ligase-associated DNA damage response endonuclease PdeM n=1 Tax=Robiginitalea aurantiaca TaxID=3056915 RepID=A0ABT7WB97_9FLAO|nr:ligase-associated DNA damage response endonuclease PdeM [Robiginitalea aurantiaca]MDM9630190.1 ligase-associated DNA damage response endonuclease PdeM [Robiginitalea aurantiaca]
MTQTVDFGGETLHLHPWGALYREAADQLLVSDLHLGKISHFRKHGAAVPLKATARNFERLDDLLDEFQPESIAFLGDLFHSYRNREWDDFAAWVKTCGTRLILIEGNHDILGPLPFEKLGIQVCATLQSGPFTYTHHPLQDFEGYNIAGHIHPAVRLTGEGRQSLRVPCFHFRNRQLILPAFGAFTGSHLMKIRSGDRIYALAGDAIFPLEAASLKNS